MQIAVSGKFSHEHVETAVAAVDKFRELLQNSEIQNINAALGGFVFFPVIISDHFGVGNKSHRSYSRKENAEFVNGEINVAEWASADEHGRLRLLADALESAIRGTRSGRLHDSAKEAIVDQVRLAVEASGR